MIRQYLRAPLIANIAMTFLLVHSMVDAGEVSSSTTLSFVVLPKVTSKTRSRINTSTTTIPSGFHRMPDVPVMMEPIYWAGLINSHHQLYSCPKDDQDNAMIHAQTNNDSRDRLKSWLNRLVEKLSSSLSMPVSFDKPPPMQIDDFSLLFYDIFLLLNLSVSVSFWVVHRLSLLDILPAFSEGSLLCILWIISGLWNGAFLYSAVDGHYDPREQGNGEDEGKGGPTYAALLGLSTFVTTANLRVIIALVTAMVEHRRVGAHHGEDLIPLEIACGLILMASWRMLHSSFTPRS